MDESTTTSNLADDSNLVSETVIGINKVVGFHYRLCDVDSEGSKGEYFEESKDKGILLYLHGFHNLVIGLERALEGRSVGDRVEITLEAEQAYGARDPAAILRVPLKKLQMARDAKKPVAGGLVRVRSERGWRNGIILKPGKFNVDVDFNHPLAGRTLHYEVQVELIRDASEEELKVGRAHKPKEIKKK